MAEPNNPQQGGASEQEANLLATQIILAIAAVVAIGIAIWQMCLTQRSFEASGRAWVLIDQIPMRPSDQPLTAAVPGSFVMREGANVNAVFRNYGGGPAFDVNIAVRFACVPFPERCPDPSNIVPNDPSQVILGPDHALSIDRPYNWADCSPDSVLGESPTHRLFAHGKVTYVDGFKKPRRTLMCAVYNPALRIRDAAAEQNKAD